jgi:plasmid stabilization system protein ParE
MKFTLKITRAAKIDIKDAIEYYNNQLDGLGQKFGHALDLSLISVSKFPNAFAVRYNDVRGKLVKKFPYVIYYQINQNTKAIEVLRVF